MMKPQEMKMADVLVQIAITGDYMENYAANDWDGQGECPQHWKCKGTSPMPFLSNVAPQDVAMMLSALEDAAVAHSHHDDFSWLSYTGVRFYPNGLSASEFIEFDYKMYSEITSVSQADIQAFLAIQADLYARVTRHHDLGFVEPQPLPYEEYDMM
jgi:hypothetical protein